MTNEQRELVLTFRREGLGYGAISRKTGISVNTVKSFCRRNVPKKPATRDLSLPAVEHACRCCGAPVRQNTGRKEKKFCSDQCRNQWWNTHRDQIDRRAIRTLTCENCGKTFFAYGKAVRRYCCHDCYIRHRFGGAVDA